MCGVMLPMESLIYGPSSSALLHLRIATYMELLYVILGLSKIEIRVASMRLMVFPTVTLLWIQSKGKCFPPSMTGLKMRNNIWE